jgi:hypothetical protein
MDQDWKYMSVGVSVSVRVFFDQQIIRRNVSIMMCFQRNGVHRFSMFSNVDCAVSFPHNMWSNFLYNIHPRRLSPEGQGKKALSFLRSNRYDL